MSTNATSQVTGESSTIRSATVKALMFIAGFVSCSVLYSGGGLSTLTEGITSETITDRRLASLAQYDMFDKMQRHLYGIANSNHHVRGNRKLFTLGSVAESKGGLKDSDRKLMGELYYNATSVFEFGLGESTMIAAHVGVPRYSGVDSDAVWVAKARGGSKAPHFRFSFADIGDTKAWGNPADDKLKKIPLDYQTATLNNELDPFDLYLVDGRYRVACACASMLHAMSRGGDMLHVMVAIHDYWDRESVYGEITEVADLVHRSERLAVFKVKPSATEQDITRIWENHIWDKS